MKIKFTPGPAARIASVPDFAGFDGVERHCKQYRRAKGGVMRCASYREGSGHPTCAGLNPKNVRSTGNSKHPMLRTRPCSAKARRKKSGARRRRK